MKLDHASIVTPHLEVVRDFFCRIAGLTEGKRPPFPFDGHWLYQDGIPVIHLIGSNTEHPPAKTTSRIDHVAFRINSETEWNALLARLQAADIVYHSSAIPASGERQVFVMPTPGVMIEFVIASAASD